MSDTQRFGTVVVASPNRPPRGATLLRTVGSTTPAAAPEVESGAERWVRGIIWQPDACGDGDIARATGLCGNGTFSGFDSPVARPDLASYLPPMVAVGQSCSGISGEQALNDAAARASALLERCQTVGVARELWRGDVAQADVDEMPNDWLAKASTLDSLNSGDPTPALEAFASLEDALGHCSCGGVGIIHATARTVTYWARLNLVDATADGRIVSALGTLIVADPGYDGSDSDGVVDESGATAWAYGTTMVDVRLGRVAVTNDSSTLNIATNDFDVYAYRPFAATFDPCCHVGVQVNHAELT